MLVYIVFSIFQIRNTIQIFSLWLGQFQDEILMISFGFFSKLSRDIIKIFKSRMKIKLTILNPI